MGLLKLLRSQEAGSFSVLKVHLISQCSRSYEKLSLSNIVKLLTLTKLICSETQQPQHLMPPTPVAQLAQNERMPLPTPPTPSAVPMTSHLAPVVTLPDKIGAPVGIQANPIYAQAETAPAKQVNTLATQV